MAAWTLAQAQARLQMYLDAEEKILTGHQEVMVDGKISYKRANLAQIQRQIAYWRAEVERLEAENARGPVFRPGRVISP